MSPRQRRWSSCSRAARRCSVSGARGGARPFPTPASPRGSALPRGAGGRGGVVGLLGGGGGVVGGWGWGRVKAFADTGFPAEFVYPREGGFVLGIVGCPVEGSKNAVEANAFLQYMLSPAVQMTLALRHGSGPANTRVVLTPQQHRGLPYGGQARALKALDWDTANAKREEWTRRWNREIER